MPGDRRVDVVGVQPLHRLGRAGDGRRRLAELDGQRLDDLDLGLGQADEHRRQLGHRLRAGLHPDALAALARVVQLELVVLGDDLLGQRRPSRSARRGRGATARRGGVGAALALQEIERHVRPPRRSSGSGVMVAGATVSRLSGSATQDDASSGRSGERPIGGRRPSAGRGASRRPGASAGRRASAASRDRPRRRAEG